MLYKPNKLQLEDRLIGYNKENALWYARIRCFDYIHHYKLSNYSGLLATTYTNIVSEKFKDKNWISDNELNNLIDKVDYNLDNICQKIVKEHNIDYPRPTLFCLVGIPGSGKSHLAQEIKCNCESSDLNRETIIVSSDTIREEYNLNSKNQKDNSKTFEIYYNIIKQSLKEGKNVICDALNINIKDRQYLFNAVKNIDCKKQCYIKIKSIPQCVIEDSYRSKSKSVGVSVIQSQTRKFQIPFYNEGWDDIVLSYRKDDVEPVLNNRFDDNGYTNTYFKQMLDTEQNNPHHNETIGNHSLTTLKLWNNSYSDKYNIDYDIAVKYHDVGKLFTQTTDENDISHFYNHEEFGTYLMLENINFFTQLIKQNHPILTQKEVENIFLKQLFLVNYHMMPFAWEKQPKRYDKDLKIFGKDNIELLKDFNECDRFREKELDKTFIENKVEDEILEL